MPVLRLILTLSVLIATPAWAGTSWLLAQKSGEVWVTRNGLQPASVELKSSLKPGDIITTGAGGRAMLTRGADYLVVAPQSRLLLPGEQQSGFTRLVQQLGTIFYKVKPTGNPNFSVDAPMLAAVVKGTSFTVIVEPDHELVQVTEGIVEVTTASGSARQLVHGGKTVMVSRDQPDDMFVVDPSVTTLPGPMDSTSVRIERSGDVSLAELAGLSNGLVRADPAAASTRLASATVTLDSQTVAAQATDLAGITPTTPVTEVVTAVLSPVTSPIATPVVTAPTVSIPTIETPTVTTPIATVPTVTVPGVTVPTAPTVPTVPIAPSIPTVPTVPTAPTVPTVPTAPTAPSVPTVPIAPSVPTVPTAPSVPTIPVAPSIPTAPSVPSVPAIPTAPIVPTAPSLPGG